MPVLVAPISPEDLRQRVADAPTRLLQEAWLVQGKIDWLSRHVTDASDPTAASDELLKCHAWSQALAAGDLGPQMTASDDQSLLDAIAAVDQATAQNAALGAIASAVDGLVQAYAAP